MESGNEKESRIGTRREKPGSMTKASKQTSKFPPRRRYGVVTPPVDGRELKRQQAAAASEPTTDDASTTSTGCPQLCCPPALRRVRRHRFLRLGYLRNAASFLTFTLLFSLVNVALFTMRVLQHQDKPWLEQVARGSGFCLNLDCALVLMLVLRRLLTWLRSKNVGQLLPLEHHVYLHKMVGWSVYVLSMIHTFFHMANFVNMSRSSGVSVYDYLFDTSMGIGWFAGSANITGIALLVLLTVMVVCSHSAVRKSGYFEVFYWTHLLSIPTWVLLVLHSPNFWKWLLVPGLLFTIEIGSRMCRVFGQRGRSHITSAVLMPSDVVRLTVERPPEFRFHPGDFCYINIPAVAKYEWHPFTISSSSENEDEITFHIRAVGEWTRSLHSKLLDACLKSYIHDQFVLKTRSNSVAEPPAPLAVEHDTKWQKFARRSATSRSQLTSGNRSKSSDGVIAAANSRNSPTRSTVPMATTADPSRDGRFRSAGESETAGYDNEAFQQADSDGDSTGGGLDAAAVDLSQYDGAIYNEQRTDGDATYNEQRTDGDAYMESSCVVSLGKNSQPSRRQKLSIIQHGSVTNLNWRVILDGPFGAPCTGIFHSQHAVLVAAGIGVTPFASVLHCISDRYNAAHRPCPHCSVPTCLEMPSSMLKLKKVDFVWVNRDMRSFEWFLELLHELRESQRRPGSPMDSFLSVQLYKTSSTPIVGPVPLRNEVKQGRPDWDQVFGQIRARRKGRVSVFYCGPPALASVVREKSAKYGFAFVKEMF